MCCDLGHDHCEPRYGRGGRAQLPGVLDPEPAEPAACAKYDPCQRPPRATDSPPIVRQLLLTQAEVVMQREGRIGILQQHGLGKFHLHVALYVLADPWYPGVMTVRVTGSDRAVGFPSRVTLQVANST